jgi:hypothetical protein
MRTYSEYPLFKDEKTREVLTSVLVVWALENSDVSYKQGMNEIIALIYIVMYPFYLELSQKGKENLEEKIQKSLDTIECKNALSSNEYRSQFTGENIRNIFIYLNCDMEADLYLIFDNFMRIKDLKSFYYVPNNNFRENKDLFEDKVIKLKNHLIYLLYFRNLNCFTQNGMKNLKK